MFCTGCGRQLQDADAFCSACGKATAPLPPPKRFCRVMAEKKIAGVCAGVAQYLGVDVTVVRLAWVLLVLLHGFGLIAYLVAWIIMPRDTDLARRQQFAQ